MARIRSIKPDFWTSEQIVECSTNARLMFIGMWNFADDHGRMRLSPKSIKAQVFPADPIEIETIRRMIDELSSNGLILTYVVDGQEYLQITGWHHQKIDRRQEAKYPPPPEGSTNVRRTLAPDKIGEDKKGKEDAAAPAARSDSSPEIDYFRRVKEICGASGGGLGKKLLDAKGGSIPLARAAIEQASTKQDPREYLGAIIRGRDGSDDLRARGEAW